MGRGRVGRRGRESGESESGERERRKSLNYCVVAIVSEP